MFKLNFDFMVLTRIQAVYLPTICLKISESSQYVEELVLGALYWNQQLISGNMIS